MSEITNKVHKAIIAFVRKSSENNDDISSKISSLSDEQIVNLMFSNTRGKEKTSRGLMLTQFGLQVMKAYSKGYECPMPQGVKLTAKHLLYLDSKSTLPYYCSNKEGFVIFDKYLGTKLMLADGRIDTLIEIENGK